MNVKISDLLHIWNEHRTGIIFALVTHELRSYVHFGSASFHHQLHIGGTDKFKFKFQSLFVRMTCFARIVFVPKTNRWAAYICVSGFEARGGGVQKMFWPKIRGGGRYLAKICPKSGGSVLIRLPGGGPTPPGSSMAAYIYRAAHRLADVSRGKWASHNIPLSSDILSMEVFIKVRSPPPEKLGPSTPYFGLWN